MDGTQLQNDSSHEREYAHYLAEIEVRKQRVAVARADLGALESDLERFETAYHARTGALLIELARVELATEANQHRIERLRTRPEMSATELDAEIATIFETRRQQLHDDEQTIRFHERQFEKDRETPELDSDDREELRRRYCDLVMRFLPDLARTEAERAQWAPVMERADFAYRNRDLAGLRALEHEPAYADPVFDAQPVDEKLVWAIREMARVFDLRMEIGRETTDLRMGDTFKLWTQSRTEPDTIDQLVRQIEQELEAARTDFIASSALVRDLAREQGHD